MIIDNDPPAGNEKRTVEAYNFELWCRVAELFNWNGPNVRAAVHFGIILGKNGPPPPHFFLEPLFLGKYGGCGPKPFSVASFQFSVKNMDFWGLKGYKRGVRFGKCTKSVPFLDRFRTIYED